MIEQNICGENLSYWDNQLLPRYEYQLLKTKETCQDVNETLSGKKGLAKIGLNIFGGRKLVKSLVISPCRRVCKIPRRRLALYKWPMKNKNLGDMELLKAFCLFHSSPAHLNPWEDLLSFINYILHFYHHPCAFGSSHFLFFFCRYHITHSDSVGNSASYW